MFFNKKLSVEHVVTAFTMGAGSTVSASRSGDQLVLKNQSLTAAFFGKTASVSIVDDCVGTKEVNEALRLIGSDMRL